MARMKVHSADLDGEQLQTNIQEDGTAALVWVANTDHKFANNGRVILYVTTSAGASQTMTIGSQLEVSGLGVENRVINLTASQTHVFGPFPPNIHNETSGNDAGYTSVQFSNITGLAVAAIRLP